MIEARSYTLPGGVSVSRMQPAIGAVVSGINLSLGLPEEQAASLRAALFAHGVIVLRGQDGIGYAQHLALARAFGTPITDGPDAERPEITPVRSRAFSREGTASAWHSDGSYQSEPPSVSILRAITPCSFGGDTCWSSGTAAYAALPEEMKSRIDTLRFNTSLAARMPKKYNHFGSADNWETLNSKYPPITQPVVVCHPVTGKRALYVNATWALGIDGMDQDEADTLIARLSAEFLRPEYQARWQWQAGDIALWDNRIVQHYGVPDQTEDRYLERITVQGGPMLSVAEWQARAAAGF